MIARIVLGAVAVVGGCAIIAQINETRRQVSLSALEGLISARDALCELRDAVQDKSKRDHIALRIIEMDMDITAHKNSLGIA